MGTSAMQTSPEASRFKCEGPLNRVLFEFAADDASDAARSPDFCWEGVTLSRMNSARNGMFLDFTSLVTLYSSRYCDLAVVQISPSAFTALPWSLPRAV